MTPALSPSRASDFKQCPLLYRFRVIDKLESAPSPAAARGTLVHAVLESLFDLPAQERTPEAAVAMLQPEWARLVDERPELAEMITSTVSLDEDSWFAEAGQLLTRWFDLEDPTLLEPAERELYIEAPIEMGEETLTMRGYIDRVDVAPGDLIRIVDYKTGRSPSERFEAKALFQMKFYALAVWKQRGVIPAMLQLVYLKNGEVLRYQPTEGDLRSTEKMIVAIWKAIERSASTGDWRPSRSRLCEWCDFTSLCPEFGGTPPPLPEDSSSAAVATENSGASSPNDD